MPRFYFDTAVNGESMEDDEGVELASREMARMEAVLAAAEMAKDEAARHSLREVAINVREGIEPILSVRLPLIVEEKSQRLPH
jgi:hypothetical protein